LISIMAHIHVGQPVLQCKRLSGKWYQSFHEWHCDLMVSTSGAVAAPEVVRLIICLMSALKLEKKEKVIDLMKQIGKFEAFKQLELEQPSDSHLKNRGSRAATPPPPYLWPPPRCEPHEGSL